MAGLRTHLIGVARVISISIAVSTLVVVTDFPDSLPSPASAATLSSGICSSTVGNSSNVTIAQDGYYCVLEFKNAGSTTWAVPNYLSEAEVLIVGGGGGGGSSYWGGGGGAGGVVHFPSYTLSPSSTITVVVGGGGQGGPAPASVTQNGVISDGHDGQDSSFDAKVALGGGGGGAYAWQWNYSTGNGRPGGSGGGTGQHNSSQTVNGGASTQPTYAGAMVFGNSGGKDSANGSSGGGGGAGGVGLGPAAGTGNTGDGGNGGSGKSFTISGTARFFAGGGGGGTLGATGGTGGSSIGGSGGKSSSINGTNGSSNTGSGGGGAGWNNSSGGAGGSGGSGIVIVRFLAASPPESLIVSNTGSFTDGFFSSDGTWVTTTPTGTARISTSAVLDQLAVGDVKLVATSGSAQIQSSISSNAANSLTVKATGDVLVTQIATHISLGGGDFIAWADSDASNEGRIEVNDDFVLETGGGAAIFAGGSDSNSDGQPEGFAATSQASQYGLLLREDYSITTNGGNVVLRGKTLPGAYRAVVFEMAGLIDSGAGKISISGVSTATQTYTSGIYVSQDGINEDRPHVWTSANGSADAISVYGESLGASGTNRNGIASVYGSGNASKWGISISATAPGGGVQLEGKVNASTTADQCGRISSGISLDSLRVSAIDGPISITGTKTGISDATLEFALQFDTFATCPSSTYQGLPTSLETAGTVTLNANSIDQRTAIEISAGSLTIQPTGTSFDGSIDFGATLSASVAQSLQLGKPSNTANITLSQPIDLTDSLKVFGGNIRAFQPITVPNLAIDAAGQIALAGANDFDVIEVRTSKASPTAADVSINDIDNYIVGDVDSSFTGVYGVPKNLEIVTVPATGDEDVAFTISARLTSDGYQIPLQSNNHSIATLSISKAQGAGSLTGVTSIVVTSSNLATFSSLVLTGISSPTSASFSVSGAALVPQETGLIHFQNQPSSDASLAALTLSSGALSPSFGSATLSYQVTVPGGTSSITFTPTANDSGHQQIEIIYTGGTEVVTSGQASSGLTLTYGLNTFAIEVIAENGSTSSYTVTVYRQLTQQVDWNYSNVSITQPNGSVSTASAFTDMYGASRTSALSDDVTLDEDGLPQKTITLKVGEVLHLPMTSNHGNAMGYGGISGAENHICKIDGFTKNFGTQSGHYTIRALKAGACNGVFVTVHQRNTMVMLSLGARGIDLGSNYFRTPYVNIVVERKDQTQAALHNGASSNSSTAVWNEPQTLEIRTTEQTPLGNKSYSYDSGPCTVTTKPVVIGGVSYYFMATAEVVATGAGTCVIEGAQAQDSIYNAKTWSHTITFGPATQTLAFTSNVPAEPIVGSSYSPAVTSSAMLAVTLGVTTGNGTVCNINGSGEVSFIAAGSCTIQATGISNANYQAPAPISQTLVVGTANQSITFNQIPDKEIGDTAFRAMANATSGLVVSFTTVTSNTICTVSTAGLVTIVGEGQCSVTANQAGNSQVGAAQSVTRVFTIRPEGSSAPFITAVSYGDGSLTATLVAPSYTGGNSILDYSLFAYNASNQNVAVVTGCNASATPVQCTVTGLTNGQPYTLKAAARTSAGLGSLSGPSQAVTPLANPQAVNGLTALAGNQTLTITWQPPSSLGGGDFARFDIRIRPAGGNFPGLSAPSATISAITESSYVFTGLQNGVSYDVEMITITTEPASGMSAATLQSHTARVLQTPFTRPNAPRNLAAFEVDNSVKIAFAYPDFDGGRQVDEYRVSVNGTTVCTPTQIQVCSVPMATLTSLMSSPFVGGIGFQQQPGSLGFLSTTTTQVPIEVVAVNDGGTSDPATTTYNLVTGSSTPPPSSGGNGVVGSITNLPTITSYSKQVLQSTGDSFTITGTNFALISEIWAADTKLSFLRTSNDVIRITTPELPLGPHSLVLRGPFGVVTVQDAVSVIEGRIAGESTRITRTFVDGFTGRSTYLGPTNVAKLRSFVAEVKPGTVIKCYGSIPDRARMDNIKLAFKRADRVCDFVQSLNPNIEVVRTWVWKDGNEAWDRSQVRLTLFEY